jgi:hypothetical protein
LEFEERAGDYIGGKLGRGHHWSGDCRRRAPNEDIHSMKEEEQGKDEEESQWEI